MKQIFTFGFGQKHEGCYIEIEGKDKNDCRSKMFKMFGNKWSVQYDTKEQAGVDEWGLKEIK